MPFSSGNRQAAGGGALGQPFGEAGQIFGGGEPGAEAGHGGLHAGAGDGFQQVVERGFFEGLHGVFVVGGDENGPGNPIGREGGEHAEAVHAGHTDIQEDDVGTKIVEGGRPRTGRPHTRRESPRRLQWASRRRRCERARGSSSTITAFMTVDGLAVRFPPSCLLSKKYEGVRPPREFAEALTDVGESHSHPGICRQPEAVVANGEMQAATFEPGLDEDLPGADFAFDAMRDGIFHQRLEEQNRYTHIEGFIRDLDPADEPLAEANFFRSRDSGAYNSISLRSEVSAPCESRRVRRRKSASASIISSARSGSSCMSAAMVLSELKERSGWSCMRSACRRASARLVASSTVREFALLAAPVEGEGTRYPDDGEVDKNVRAEEGRVNFAVAGGRGILASGDASREAAGPGG